MRVTNLQPDEVFVFGSNLAGKHFGGAARDAYQLFGAVMGDGEGMTGQCYAIPTLDEQFKKRTLADINTSVESFIEQAKKLPTKRFIVTPIGCGIAGFSVEQIAPMFRHAPANCILPDEFKPKSPSSKAAIASVLLFLFGLQAGFAAQPSAIKDADAVRAIVGEAANQHYRGMLAVAGAIRNRGTLDGVYGLKSKTPDKQPQWVWDLATKAWSESQTNDITKGATNWENVKAFGMPKWAKSMHETVTIGDHKFFKP